eukprot:6701913-Pyramimonas_sp.AAC.1
MRNPVCPLYLSLYGHPDSGGSLEQHCEGHVTAEGCVKCSPWRSCYFHKELKIFLIIYVVDFKLLGPADKLATGWKLLQEPSENCPKGIERDPPTAVGRYLGCEHRLPTQTIEWHGELLAILDPPPPKVKKNASVADESSEQETGAGSASQTTEPYQPREPKLVKVIEYDLTEFFDSCVTLYAQLTYADPATYPAAGTPFGPELIDLEDGQGGPRAEVYSPAEEAIASALQINVATGPPDQEIEVLGLDAAVASPDDPEPPTQS